MLHRFPNVILLLNGHTHCNTVRARHDPTRNTAGTLEETERRMLIDALDKTGWNQTRAAMLLGISRDTLRYKVKKYNLPRPAGAEAEHLL